MVGVIMEKDNTTVFNLTCNPFIDTVGGGTVFPVKRVNIRYKSNNQNFVKIVNFLKFFVYNNTVILNGYDRKNERML